jgi:hypothetical protein
MNRHIKLNIQDALRTIAVIAMIIDHVGLFFYPEYEFLRVPGRVVMPIFCFFTGYNFTKPKLKILILGLMINVMEYLCIGHIITLNILVSIYISQCALYLLYKSHKTSEWDLLGFILLLILCNYIALHIIEYGTLTIAFAIAGAYLKNKEDIGFVPFLCLLHVLFTIALFNFNFLNNLIATTLICITSYFLRAGNFNKSVNFRVVQIGRYSLMIYVTHLIFIIALYSYLRQM